MKQCAHDILMTAYKLLRHGVERQDPAIPTRHKHRFAG
jgi:hypothetical protein